MFADNQTAKQRRPLLTCIGISTPAPHNLLRHMRSQLRHDALRSAAKTSEMSEGDTSFNLMGAVWAERPPWASLIKLGFSFAGVCILC